MVVTVYHTMCRECNMYVYRQWWSYVMTYVHECAPMRLDVSGLQSICVTTYEMNGATSIHLRRDVSKECHDISCCVVMNKFITVTTECMMYFHAFMFRSDGWTSASWRMLMHRVACMSMSQRSVGYNETHIYLRHDLTCNAVAHILYVLMPFYVRWDALVWVETAWHLVTIYNNLRLNAYLRPSRLVLVNTSWLVFYASRRMYMFVVMDIYMSMSQRMNIYVDVRVPT